MVPQPLNSSGPRRLIGFIIFLILTPGLARSATWYVDPGGTGDVTTIQAGIDSSIAGDTVVVACGTYVETGPGPEGEIVMKAGVTLKSETGEPDCVVISGIFQRRVMICDGDNTTRIEGITIQHGSTTGNGGGLASTGDIFIERCLFADNTADSCGAVSCSGSPTFIDCEFFDNSATEGCGAICGPGVLIRCLFDGNNGGNTSGGAVCGGSIIKDSQFLGNSALLSGGAVEGTPDSILNCVFVGNTATDPNSSGGAVFGEDVGAIVRCIFALNVAWFGGALNVNSTNITRSTFYDNGAITNDGAIHARGACTVDNTIIGLTRGGDAITCSGGGSATVSCSNIYGNAEGDYVGCIIGQGSLNDNISQPPLFCDPAAGDFGLDYLSPCLPSNNTCGELIGALGQLCGCIEDGDVNNSASLTAGDALCAFNISLLGGQLTPSCDVADWDCELIASNVNCDGSLTAGDALEIFNRSLLGGDPEACFAQSASGPSASARAESNLFAVPFNDAVAVGNALTVPVVMEASRGATAFGFEVHFDPDKLEYQGIEISTAAAHWKALDARELAPGRVRAMGFDTEGLRAMDTLESGMVEIAVLRFRKLSEEKHTGSVEWIEQRLDREPDSEPDNTPDQVTKLDLSRPYPNPFHDVVTTYLMIPAAETPLVNVSVYDVKGRRVRTLLNRVVSGGVHSVSWDRRTAAGQPVSSGIYFLRMEVKAHGVVRTQKLVVLQ